jgi:hypothetical protein
MYDSGAIARKDHLRKAPDRLYQTASSRNMESRSDLFNNGFTTSAPSERLPVCVDVQEYISDILVRQNL